MRPDQLIFRCNFVTILDGRMKDFTAGHIAQAEADALVAALQAELADEGCELHAGVSYRNLMLLARRRGPGARLRAAPRHHRPAGRVALAAGSGRRAARAHRGARARGDRGPPGEPGAARAGARPGDRHLAVGTGPAGAARAFASRFGLRAAVITGVDILRGMARLMGMEIIEVPGATGYIDTDYAGKGAAAVRALDEFDLVVVHVEAADESAHMGNAGEKVLALERMDEAVVGPLLGRLARSPAWRVLVAVDHPTLTTTRGHSAIPPLFAYAGTGVAAVERAPFTEAAAERGGYRVEPAHRLMEVFLRG